jgi:alpha-tubulin suppressor-like RCC1 family protein
MTNQDWFDIATGYGHTIALKTNKSLWVWGDNGVGQLGLGDTNQRNSPTQSIITIQDWSTIAAGYWHTVALKTNKTLWAWGSNEFGQLGLGNTTNKNSPTQSIMTTQDWSAIDAGSGYTIALKTNKTLWGWGLNTFGQLGSGNTTSRNSPIQSIMTTQDWSAIAAGYWHTVALKTNKTLWVWGFNAFGQLGMGDVIQRNSPTQSIMTTQDWSAIAVGSGHTIALKTNKTLWAWGYNEIGQLGLGDFADRNTPVQVGTDSDWINLTCGYYYTMGLKTMGTLWAWGYNEYGQLGIGNTIDRNIPTLVGE